ncbi:MAG: hypothetical protein JWM17_1645 [Actinobacteria bacterium]|jgi:uncharacterized membrane protein HdeD (DUF308 family)|nr:hypothetical protein [Actinomycetota bacterium]MCW3043309.1 hypothetical protein [Actinomycetota bacterium]MEA2505338.1 hypothetical protein [Actinomycetota bacterium]MEA2567215.1 hypothetical protein [Actinomycetota bacterium]
MMGQMAVGDWRWIALRAVAAFIFGILALVLPGLTLATLVLIFGAFALVDGLFTLGHAVTRGRGSGWGAVWMGLMGLAGIGAGIVTFFWPGITALALLYVIAAWALVTGVFEIAAAITFRKVLNHEWLLVVDGVLSLIVAGILVFAPVTGALAITWAIGFYALFSSGVLAAQAWRLRKVGSRGPAGGWAPAGA